MLARTCEYRVLLLLHFSMRYRLRPTREPGFTVGVLAGRLPLHHNDPSPDNNAAASCYALEIIEIRSFQCVSWGSFFFNEELYEDQLTSFCNTQRTQTGEGLRSKLNGNQTRDLSRTYRLGES